MEQATKEVNQQNHELDEIARKLVRANELSEEERQQLMAEASELMRKVNQFRQKQQEEESVYDEGSVMSNEATVKASNRQPNFSNRF